jgi:glycosyltransferase involved in cell wall biosynthesis
MQLSMGGKEMLVLNLSRELAARGHDVTVLSMSEGGELRGSFGAIPVLDVTRHDDGSPMGLFMRLTRVLRGLSLDVVHTHNAAPLLYGAAAARAAGVRCVVHTRHSAKPYGTQLGLTASRVAARMLTAFVSVSDVTGDVANARERPPAKIAHVVPNGVPLGVFGATPERRARIRAELGIPADALVVGSVGRLANEKDFPFLVRSMAPLVDHGTRLVIVGEGDDRSRIEQAIRDHVPRDRRAFVHLTGVRKDVPDLLASFDVFALSSWTEGLPLVILEAMATGLPIVATSVGGIPNVVLPTFGRLVSHADDAAMRHALDELVHSKALRVSLGEAAHREAHARYSLASMTSAYERLYALRTGVG